MKKILLSLFLAATGMVSFAQNFTINGIIVDSNSDPVANQTVYIYSDSLFGYYNTVYTNSSGNFTDVVPNGAQIGPNVDYFIYTSDNCNPNSTLSATLSNQQGTVTSGSVTFTTCANSSSSACSASFFAMDTTGNGDFMFFDMSSGNNLNYYWDFGDGNTSTLQNPTHTYAITGTYTVCLTVGDGFFCTDTYCSTVIAGNSTCQANFYAYNDTVNNIVYLVDLSSSPNGTLTYFWDFGDGGTSTLQYPTYTYANYGMYNVCLTIADNSSCSSTYCDSVGFFQFAGDGIRSGFTINVIPASSVGVDEVVSTINDILIYPNPTNENASIEFNSTENGNYFISVMDITGKIVYAENYAALTGANRKQINLRSYDAGMYIVTIADYNGNIHQVRLIKE